MARVLLILLAMTFAVPSTAQKDTLRDYVVLFSDKEYEVRRYPKLLLASVTVTGTRRRAMGLGLRLLTDYVARENERRQLIDMQSSTRRQPTRDWARSGKPLFMIGPVLQTRVGADQWTISFVMPDEYVIETIPRPCDPRVTLHEVAGAPRATHSFGGVPNRGVLARKTAALLGYIANIGEEPIGGPRYAFYDPPWTIPYPRRSEVWFEITDPYDEAPVSVDVPRTKGGAHCVWQ